MRSLPLFGALGALLALLPALAGAQPRPVPGTEMVQSEYGTPFPREIIWGKDGSHMILIPAGTFTMGNDGGFSSSETPSRVVSLPSFYIDKYEISNAQFTEFLKDYAGSRPRPTNPALLAPELPVTAINWFGAVEYANWAGRELPSEAMWERAARGPSETLYPTGSSEPTKGRVHFGLSSSGVPVPCNKDTGDVSGYGVFHMGGNLSEWTRDWYSSTYYGTGATDDPQGPEEGENKVIRGGAYTSNAPDTRATRRGSYPPSLALDDVGFRTVWVPRPVAEATPSPSPIPTMPPLPSEDVVLARQTALIGEYVAKGEDLPRQQLAGPAFRYQGEDWVEFGNMTPYDLSLSFVSPEEDQIYAFDLTVPSMSFQRVTINKAKDLTVLAYGRGAPNPGPHAIGQVRAESNPLVVVSTGYFAEVLDETGAPVPFDGKEAPQYYDKYSPMWNEFEVVNGAELPVTVTISRGTGDNLQTAYELTLEPGQVARLAPQPSTYQITPGYVGAREASGTGRSIRLDDKAARRLFKIEPGTRSDDRVLVFTRRVPKLEVTERTAIRRR